MRAVTVEPAHRQGDYRVRFDWGLDGATAVSAGADVAVVIDVLSFTTTVSVALDRGIAVLPYRSRDRSAETFARDQHAALAVGRSRAVADTGLSLSPAAVRAHPAPPARLVLPSPNGSSIAHHFGAAGVECVAACLRNAAAVAAWLSQEGSDTQTVAVIAAGERWPGGDLRPAAEDAWGAGAVLAELCRLGWTGLSIEAESVLAGYASVRGREGSALLGCASGRELVERGFHADVEIAAEVNQSRCVPILRGEQFLHAPMSGG
jgi:2-phosphosulfolactate phosphatase